MRIVLDYRNPTPAHCDVAIFVDGALAGTIRLRQEEIVSFQMIVAGGCRAPLDSFVSTGNPAPPPRVDLDLGATSDRSAK